MENVRGFLESKIEKSRIDEVVKKLIKYREHILVCNEQINLTAIKDAEEFEMKHILDSLLAYDKIRNKKYKKFVDIGTGAGFPGVPLAVVFPEKEFFLVDSIKKRLTVIEEGIDKIGLENVTLLHTRAEDLGREDSFREAFDVAVSRAVAPMSILLEFAIPLLKTNGVFVAYKGPNVYDELEKSSNAMRELGAELLEVSCPEEQNIEMINLNEEENKQNHRLVIIKKVKKTSEKYPRKAGKANKFPL